MSLSILKILKSIIFNLFTKNIKFFTESFLFLGSFFLHRGHFFAQGVIFLHRGHFFCTGVHFFCTGAIFFAQHCIMGTNDTFNFIMFKYFLHQMLQYLPNKWMLVADNASIHKTNEIQRFLISINLLLTTIPTYSPWINPSEHLILAIKVKLGKFREMIKW